MKNQTVIALTEGSALSASFNHNLRCGAPSSVRGVLLCTTADTISGAQPGDEIDLASVANNINSVPAFGLGSNQDMISVFAPDCKAADMTAPWRTGVNGFSSMSNFSVKIYWE